MPFPQASTSEITIMQVLGTCSASLFTILKKFIFYKMKFSGDNLHGKPLSGRLQRGGKSHLKNWIQTLVHFRIHSDETMVHYGVSIFLLYFFSTILIIVILWCLFCVSLEEKNWVNYITRFPGKARLTKLWRLNPFVNISWVGFLPMNISNNRIPKLCTSPCIDASPPIPYSAFHPQFIKAMLGKGIFLLEKHLITW